MCSCRLVEPLSSQKSPVRLEDYYSLLEMDGSLEEKEIEDDDLYSQLEQKEKDLILAAELGKALLEKNEELSRIHEQSVEEYNARVEELEQEKYHLKLRLDTVTGEYDNTVRELQWDITNLRQQMEEKKQLSQESDKDRSQIIRELTQQNERLTDQLRKTTLSEEELTCQVQSLREQLTSRRTSMHDHIHQLEVLQDEINLLTGRTLELERRLAVVTEERDSLGCSLEECQDRILMLGKQNHEQENQIRLKGRDLEELRATNAHLEDQVENISQRLQAPLHFNQSQNLFSELSQLSDSPDVDMGSKSPLPHSLYESDWMNDEEIECDDSFTMATMSGSSHDSEFMNFQNSPSVEHELRRELLEAYRTLKVLYRDLKSKSADEAFDSDDCQMVQAGQLMVVIRQLRELIHSIQQKADGDNPLVEEMRTKMGELQTAYNSSQKEVVKLTTEVQLKDEDLKQRTAQLKEFLKDLRVHQDKCSALQAERDRLQDSLLGELDAEDVLNQTRSERDEAMQQRNTLEESLAKVKMDVLSLNSQLMEAIQQKVELSQKLDQWEVDMHEVLELQMQKRIQEDTVREKAVAELELTKQDLKTTPKKSFFTFSRH